MSTQIKTASEIIEASAPRSPLVQETLLPVVLTAKRWRTVAAYLDWHGKDHESELIVDAIREQTSGSTTEATT